MVILIECDLEKNDLTVRCGNLTFYTDLDAYLDSTLQEVLMEGGLTDEAYNKYIQSMEETPRTTPDDYSDLHKAVAFALALEKNMVKKGDEVIEETDTEGHSRAFRDIVDGDFTILS
jgi:hypothetical protein